MSVGHHHADDETVLDDLPVLAWCPANSTSRARYCGACFRESDVHQVVWCACGSVSFCNEACRGRGQNGGHWLPCGSGRLSRAFARKVAATPLLELCTRVLGGMVERACGATPSVNETSLKDSLTREFCELQARFPLRVPVQGVQAVLPAFDNEAWEEGEDEDEAADEVLILLLGVVRHERGDDQLLADALGSFLTPTTWQTLVRTCRLHHCIVSLPCEAADTARRLPLERDTCVKRATYAHLCSSLPVAPLPVATKGLVGDLPLPGQQSEEDVIERRVWHLAQTAGAPGETPFTANSFTALALVPMPMGHGVAPLCCCPSATFEAIRGGQQALRCRLVASRRIDPAVEAVSVQYHLSTQAAAACPCFQCDLLRGGLMRCISSSAWAKVRILAFKALAGQEFERARILLRPLLRQTTPTDQQGGDIHHALGAALVSLGLWRAAHAAWFAGVSLHPSHTGLQEATARLLAYTNTPQQSEASEASSSPVQLDPLDPSDCWTLCKAPAASPALIFLSKQPLLSAETCAWCISEAEEFASRSGGWTTARHYAVPTTDIPLHSLPRVLQWLKSVVYVRLQSCLRHLFFPHARPDTVGVCIHDAFIVKYSHDPLGVEAARTHLPLHQDESTHSLTIALNQNTEFDGGGTFFQMLDCSIRPSAGSVLGFSGSLVHGGDPILKGTRYIIAVFLMLSEEGEDTLDSQEHVPPLKSRRIDPADSQGNFSFSFSFDQ